MKKNIIVMFFSIFLLAFSEGNRVYELESGKITMETITDISEISSNSQQIIIFSEYGEKIATRTIGVMPLGETNVNIDMTFISNGKKYYQLNNIEKTYVLFSENEEAFDGNLPEDQGVYLGEEKINGKLCKIWESEEESFIIKQWLWKGIPLKIVTKINDEIISESVVTDIVMRKVSDSEFNIPSDYEENNSFNDLMDSMDTVYDQSILEGYDSNGTDDISDTDIEKAAEFINSLEGLFGEKN